MGSQVGQQSNKRGHFLISPGQMVAQRQVQQLVPVETEMRDSHQIKRSLERNENEDERIIIAEIAFL